MSYKNKLSAEIFRDHHSLDPDSLSIDPLMASISGIAKIIGEFDILDTSRFLDISNHATNHINMDDYFLDTEHLPADINVLLTDRRLTYENQLLRGVAQVLPNESALGTRIAIVSTYKNEFVAATTDHEVGHALNLSHCDNEECTMSLYFECENEGYGDIYCRKHTDQLHKNADRLRRTKAGKKISRRILFPRFYAQFPEDPFFSKAITNRQDGD